MSLYLPDEAVSALCDYIETLVPHARYASWTAAAWRRAWVPMHLATTTDGAKPLAFSLRDEVIQVVGVDEVLRYQVSMILQYLYENRPANAQADWDGSGLAGHCLLAHLFRRTPAFPAGIAILPSKSTQIRRSALSGWIMGEISLTVAFDAPLTWS